jgi:flagellar assembly factor FliW
MKLETAHFGVIEIDEADFIDFPEGIPGFENSKKYALIGHNSDESSFFWLQSIDKPELCFVVTDPFMIYDGYGVDIDSEDEALLQITDENTIMTLAIVVIAEDIMASRANLKAPVLINVDKKLGKQVIQKSDNLPIRYYLYKNR